MTVQNAIGDRNKPLANADCAGVHVLLLAPYAPLGGGMGRQMAYLAGNSRSTNTFETVETRGNGSPIASIWPVAKAAWKIAQSARRRGTVIVHVNMAEGSSVFRKGALLLWARALGLDTVLHLHAADIMSFYDGLPSPMKIVVRYIFHRATVCVVLGRPWRDWLERTLSIDPARIEILTNGVPRPKVVSLPVLRQVDTLAFLGNLLPRKGLPDLFSALGGAHLLQRDWTLVVAGGGDSRALKRQIAGSRLADRVAFAGWLDGSRRAALLARASMLVAPSHHEGLPLVLLEAASLGLPIIATAIGAIPDVFTDGETALLVRPGDPEGLARAILRLMDDSELRQSIGRNACALYDARLTLDIFETNLNHIYHRHCRAAHNVRAVGT